MSNEEVLMSSLNILCDKREVLLDELIGVQAGIKNILAELNKESQALRELSSVDAPANMLSPNQVQDPSVLSTP